MTSSSRAAEILASYAAGNRSFTALDLDEQVHDFENAMLAGADFMETFVLASFRGANLEQAVFKNANVKTCDFTNSNLAGASFEGAAIDSALFAGANLEGALFAGASEQGYVYQAGEVPAQDAA